MPSAVIYARFSCSKQREASIEDQLRVCREWCAKEGYEVVAQYCDYAVSGRTDDRPEFQRMIANAGESDVVLVYMMDRFSRDVYDAPIYKKRLREKGVKVVSATETMPDGPEAILIESIYEAMAAMESAHTARRVKRGMEGNAMKCHHNGVRVFGYSCQEDGRYAIDEDEAETVREMFARKASGESVYSITEDLRRRGVRSSSGNLIAYGSVHKMLRCEKYKGVYIWGDIRVEGGMPAIVSREEFDMAQGKTSRSTEKGAFPLSGKTICGDCGMGLTGVSGRGRHGKKYEYYRCGCGAKPVRSDWLEQSIVDTIRSMLSDREEALKIAAIVKERTRDEDAEKKADKARRRMLEAKKGIDRLMDAVAGGLDAELAKGKIDELAAQADAAEAEMKMHRSASEFDEEDFADFLQVGATLDDAALLNAFVYQVIVDEESVTVALNYDMRKNEPARINIPRVRANASWWAVGDSNPGPWD